MPKKKEKKEKKATKHYIKMKKEKKRLMGRGLMAGGK